MTDVLTGLMQESPLTYSRFVRRMEEITGSSTATGPDHNGNIESWTYRQVAEQIHRLGGLLRDLGIKPGDRVASLAFNTLDHLVLFLGVPSFGAVLQTVNPRFTLDQMIYVLQHGGAKVLFVQAHLLEVVRPILAHLPNVAHVVLTDARPGETEYPRIRDALSSADSLSLPELDERQASGLCYTSGTTGMPKGVLYSHRSTILHAMSACMVDVMAVSQRETILPIVPMYHANAWGLPHAAALVGADLVLPGRDLAGETVGRLMRSLGVTLTAGVPTVLTELLSYADREPGALATLRTAISGGSALQRPLVDGFSRHEVEVIQGWGMTETSPCVSMSRPPKDADDPASYRLSAGRINPIVEARIVDESGQVLPRDGVAVGEIQLQSPQAARSYFGDEAPDPDKFADGWLRTGDAASITPDGYVLLRDRLKDMIKSGGEWIPSAELEFLIADHPGVREVAVIAIPDEKWGERPGAVIALRDGVDRLNLDELRRFLEPKAPRWWLPDLLHIVEELPKTSVGKLDKKALRSV